VASRTAGAATSSAPPGPSIRAPRTRPSVTRRERTADPAPDLPARLGDRPLPAVEQGADVDAVRDAEAHLAVPAVRHLDAGRPDRGDAVVEAVDERLEQRRIAVGCHPARRRQVRGRPQDPGRQRGGATRRPCLVGDEHAQAELGRPRARGETGHAAAGDEQVHGRLHHVGPHAQYGYSDGARWTLTHRRSVNSSRLASPPWRPP
jgi:hypothetical protein